MADVSVYRRCLIPYARGTVSYGVNEVRLATDPGVAGAPANYWVTLTDVQLTSGAFLLMPK